MGGKLYGRTARKVRKMSHQAEEGGVEKVFEAVATHGGLRVLVGSEEPKISGYLWEKGEGEEVEDDQKTRGTQMVKKKSDHDGKDLKTANRRGESRNSSHTKRRDCGKGTGLRWGLNIIHQQSYLTKNRVPKFFESGIFLTGKRGHRRQ